MKLTRTELTAGMVYGVFQQLFLPPVILMGCQLVGIESAAIANFLYYLVNFGAWCWIFRRILKLSIQNREKLLPTVLWGIPAFYVANVVMSALTLALEPEFSNVNDASVGSMIADFPPLALAVTVLVPVAEECFFRGVLFVPFMEQRPWAGYLLSGVLFSAAHVAGYLGVVGGRTLLLFFLQYIPPALVLCRACKKADSLAAPILIHAFVNAVSVALLR